MSTHKSSPTLSALIRARLTVIGAIRLPAAALQVIEADVLKGCLRVIERTVSAPNVGRAVEAALAASAASNQGRKGADAPLPSSGDAPKAQNSVACRTHNSDGLPPADSASGVSGSPEGGQP